MSEEVRESIDALLTEARGVVKGDGSFWALDGDGSTEFTGHLFDLLLLL